MSKKEYSQEEIARFERIRLYEIDKTKKGNRGIQEGA